MDDQSKNQEFGTDIFVLDIQPHDFFQWLVHVVESFAEKLGFLSIEWSVDRTRSDSYGVIEIATLTEGGHWRDVLVTLDVVPLGGGKSIIELKREGHKDNFELVNWIASAIRADWPDAKADWGKRRRQQEKEWRNPVPLADLAATAPTPDRLAHEHSEWDKLDAVYKRNLKNEGGHPPLQANEWAFAELQLRPKDRNKIFRTWCAKYIEEVGPEVAELRDLRDTFNGAMRYRKLKEEKGDKSA